MLILRRMVEQLCRARYRWSNLMGLVAGLTVILPIQIYPSDKVLSFAVWTSLS